MPENAHRRFSHAWKVRAQFSSLHSRSRRENFSLALSLPPLWARLIGRNFKFEPGLAVVRRNSISATWRSLAWRRDARLEESTSRKMSVSVNRNRITLPLSVLRMIDVIIVSRKKSAYLIARWVVGQVGIGARNSSSRYSARRLTLRPLCPFIPREGPEASPSSTRDIAPIRRYPTRALQIVFIRPEWASVKPEYRRRYTCACRSRVSYFNNSVGDTSRVLNYF